MVTGACAAVLWGRCAVLQQAHPAGSIQAPRQQGLDERAAMTEANQDLAREGSAASHSRASVQPRLL